MRTFTPYAAVLIALAILGAGAYFVVNAPLPHESGLEPAPALLAVATSTVSEDTAEYTIDVQYPQFGIPAIDAQIKDLEFAAIDDLKQTPPVPPGSAAKNFFYSRFDSAYIGPDIISVELALSTYTGGAHPNTVFAGVAFDRESGRRLTLDDALALAGASLEEVSTTSTARLATMLGSPSDLSAAGALPDPQNYQWFTVSDDAVTFIFQPYQVAAYAYGPQRVSLPRANPL